jgi:hypothetical protein
MPYEELVEPELAMSILVVVAIIAIACFWVGLIVGSYIDEWWGQKDGDRNDEET